MSLTMTALPADSVWALVGHWITGRHCAGFSRYVCSCGRRSQWDRDAPRALARLYDHVPSVYIPTNSTGTTANWFVKWAAP